MAWSVVTVARHRQFRWAKPSKVELVASQAAPFASLVAAAARLQAALLVLDSIGLEDLAALGERLLRGERGTLAAVGSEAMALNLTRSTDLVVLLDRGRNGLARAISLEDGNGQRLFAYEWGAFHRRAATPAFAAILQARGHGAALALFFG